MHDVFKGLMETSDAIGSGLASDLSPWLKFLDGNKIRLMDEWVGGFKSKVREEFEEHKKTLDRGTIYF